MKITAKEYRTLLDRIAASYDAIPFDPETMVTPTSLADRLGIRPARAGVILSQLEKEGKLKRLSIRYPGGRRGVGYVEET